MGEDSTGPQSGRRVTVDEAARHLGLSVDAIRKRVQRDQIAHEKDPAGRVRIILDESETLQDESPDSTGQAAGELADELRDRIHYLERQVEEEREARRRADMLLAQLMQRIPELEAPREAQEARQAGAEASEGTEPGSYAPGSQETSEAAETVGEERGVDGGGVDEHGPQEDEVDRHEYEPSIARLREELLKSMEERQSSSEAPQRPQGGGLRGLRRRILGW